MNKRIYSVLFLLLLFLTGIGGVLALRLWQVKKAANIPFTPQESSFTLRPPTDALLGKIIFVEGLIKKEPRDKDEFEEVDIGVKILQGEKLATDEDSQATIEFKDFVRIDLSSNSKVNFISSIPSHFLVSQASGEANYVLLKDSQPFSVRVLSILLTFYSGEGNVSVNGDKIRIEVLSGKAKLALVDLKNETHVWELEKGRIALVDNSERRVKFD